ncbi:sensor domain-containing diguanylate cyclase [Dactylosporangium vinaceum]|uniref:Diguanylate cyclase n=1 Tax=Dactylosporangium vinaceum TaxID=53362 RepID=A0ABV5M236_9ACTN|nr:sensor domain-containing diguanylate cyclase [Dactylosporangium vinaceum]UAB99368.1 sensor domain-containing diguanylate cyclase [Dactylosporangium vinaceum]
MADIRVEPADRDAVLQATIAHHPGAFIGAVGPTGFFVDLPEELRATGLRPIVGPTSALALALPEDHRVIIDGWQRLLSEGGATVRFRPRSRADRPAWLHMIDVSHRYGVVVVVITDLDGVTVLEHEDIRPRLVTVRKDQAAVIIQADPQIHRVLGWSAGELTGRRSLELVHPDDHQRAIAAWMDLLSIPAGEARRVRLRHLHRDGHVIWFEITNHSLLHGAEPCVLAEMLDITEEMAAEEALRASEQLLRRLTEALPMSVIQIDAHRKVVYQNARGARMVGTVVGEELGERQLATVIPGDRVAVDQALDRVLREGGDADIEYGYRDPSLGLRRASAKARTLTTADGRVAGAVLCLADVTEDVRLREELRRRATLDALTGCRNRAATLAALGEALAGARWGTAAVFVDLNDFKLVNDRFGHAAGDRVLVHVARILQTVAGDAAVVGRLGGDEFVVVCADVAGPEDAHCLAAAFGTALESTPIDLGGPVLRVRASIGTAWTGPGGLPADALIAQADKKMYEAKHGLHPVPRPRPTVFP